MITIGCAKKFSGMSKGWNERFDQTGRSMGGMLGWGLEGSSAHYCERNKKKKPETYKELLYVSETSILPRC